MEMLNNGKFESGTPSVWGKWYTGIKHVYTYPEPGIVSNTPSAAIAYPTREIGKDASWVQTVNIDHTKKYKLSGKLKTQNIIGNGAIIEVDWKDVNKNYLSTSTIMTSKTGSISWTYFEGIVTPHPNAVVATVVLMIRDCSGKAWFDDISLSDTVIVTKYKCSGAPNYTCTPVTDGTGTYNTLTECQAACKSSVVTKYKCSGAPNYTCTPVTDGTGTYNTLAECQAACSNIPPGYKLTFEDNFNGTSLDMSKWNNIFESIWDPWKNCAKRSNLSVSNSQVHLKFSDEDGYGKTYTGTGFENYDFYQKRGRWEVKARFPPSNSGVVGYICIYPEPNNTWPPEIDFAETPCSPGNTITFTQHWKDGNGQHQQKGASVSGIDVTQFHVYTLDVTDTELKWYVDGVLKTTQTNMSPNDSWFFTCGILTYCDSINVSLPVYVDIDYVRIYQKI